MEMAAVTPTAATAIQIAIRLLLIPSDREYPLI
jgi:hypothetical protein